MIEKISELFILKSAAISADLSRVTKEHKISDGISDL